MKWKTTEINLREGLKTREYLVNDELDYGRDRSEIEVEDPRESSERQC